MFKKKSLKFTYNKVSRDLRHAEAFKTRETSRFKRLSVVRSINDSEFLEKSVEAPKENKVKAAETSKVSSRLEMLFKWKKEKEIKKEMEKLAKKKPFYAGNKNVIEDKASQIFKSSFNSKTSSSFNSSKFAKSKLITPCTTVQPSRIQNSRKGATPSSTIQSSNVPNSKKFTPGAPQSSRLPNPKQFTPGTSQLSSKLPDPKQTNLPKSGTNLTRSNSTTILPRKFPVSAVDKTSTLAKPAVSLARSNSSAAVSRKLLVPSSSIDKAVSSKPTAQRVPIIKRSNMPISGIAVKSKDLSKPVNKGLLESKPLPKCQEEKSIKKVGIGSSKFTSNTVTVSKQIPVQSKMSVSNVTKKLGSHPTFSQKESSQASKNLSSGKAFCFRTAVANASRQKADILLKTPIQGTPKKVSEKVSKNAVEKLNTKEIADQSLDNFPDVTFNSDISIIKPVRKSFAPVNFSFQPPEGLNNFVFDDGYDVYQDLEEVKLKFMSRTSTPNKSSGSNSGIKNSVESRESNNPIPEIEKTSDLSNSNDICISDLMTSKSYKETDNKVADKFINKQTCSPITCGIITSTVIKNSNIDVNNQISVKETDIAEIQSACEKMTLASPFKTKIEADKNINQQNSQEITSDVNRDLKCTAHEKLASLSPMKVIITADCTEAAVKNVGSKMQKDLLETPEFDPVKNGTTEKKAEDFVFLDNDKSSLDCIDLRKMKSELIIPKSLEEIDNTEPDKFGNKQTCNPVTCDTIANTEIKNSTIHGSYISEIKEACEEITSNSTMKTEIETAKDINEKSSQSMPSSVSRDLNLTPHEKLASLSPVKVVITADCTETIVKNVGSEMQKCLFDEVQPFDNSNIFENSGVDTNEMTSNENMSVNIRTSEKKTEDFLFLDESLLDSIDLSKMMVQSDDEDADENEMSSVQIPNYWEKKSNGAIPKRISMLKRMSVMNSIAEISETDEHIPRTPEKSSKSHDTKSTPRRSKRLSKIVSVDTLSDSPMKNSSHNTPRRSLRLMKISTASDNYPLSPFQEKNTNLNSRRSVRLIDLNTPEKAACEKILGENFENLDPNNFLIDFESPTMPALPSKKVSLLYSPERRKSIRKSIKGDLMSFSPL